MRCPERELDLNALVDGEINPDAEAGLLRHVAICPNCAAELASLLALKSRLARIMPVQPPPAELTAKIERSLQPYSGFGAHNKLKMGGYIISSLAIAATIVLAIVPKNEHATIRAVADAALRQNIAGAAIALADTRPGGADVWFKSQNLVTPSTPNLSAFGYKFIGCRTDVIAGHRASIIVYQRGDEQISLAVWPADHEPAHKPRLAKISQDSIQYWNNGILEFWVTGENASRVEEFTNLYRRFT